MSLTTDGEGSTREPVYDFDAGEDVAIEENLETEEEGELPALTGTGDRPSRPRRGSRRRQRGHTKAKPGMRSRLGAVADLISGLSVAAIANIVVIVILGAGLIFLSFRVNTEDNKSSLRASALTAAQTYGVYLSSYDYHNLNGPGSPWSEVEAHATAKFRKDFASTSGDLSKLLNQYAATAKGQVVDAGIQTVSGSEAVVLVFIDQTVTNTVQKPNSVTQPLRVLLTMVRQNGHWLIDNLEVPK